MTKREKDEMTSCCSQSTFCSVSPCPHVFLRRVGSLNLSPHLWENFSPNFGKTPNFSPISVTNSSPKLVNPQICPQILGQIRPQLLQQLHGHFHSQICGHLCPQIWGVTKFSHIFWENFSNQ